MGSLPTTAHIMASHMHQECAAWKPHITGGTSTALALVPLIWTLSRLWKAGSADLPAKGILVSAALAPEGWQGKGKRLERLFDLLA